jgi:hypothetical protein
MQCFKKRLGNAGLQLLTILNYNNHLVTDKKMVKNCATKQFLPEVAFAIEVDSPHDGFNDVT